MQATLTQQSISPATGSLVSFDSFLIEKNKTRATGWRWRKRWSWFRVVNIMGRLYISREVIAEFERRAMAGELAGELHGIAAQLAHAASVGEENNQNSLLG